MTDTCVHRHQIMVNDDTCKLMVGKILHVASREPGIVEVWALSSGAVWRSFRVFGTGHLIPDEYEYVGTALDGSFVWHLFEAVAF